VYLSEAPNVWDDTRSNPISLVIEPGGNYIDSEKELKLLAPKIQKVVRKDGAGYLGICRGAIAASTRLFCFENEIKTLQGNIKGRMWDFAIDDDSMHLKLYEGDVCVWQVPGYASYSTQSVHKYVAGTQSEPFSLFFRYGVFFPLKADYMAKGIEPILSYSPYTFEGYYSPAGQTTGAEVYKSMVPCAALTQKVGHGRMVLSGVHTEMGTEVVAQLPVKTELDSSLRTKVIQELKSSEKAQDDTMLDFLKILSIETKQEPIRNVQYLT
jgi:glutamine amidotransferase-like uncharacterized protein